MILFAVGHELIATLLFPAIYVAESKLLLIFWMGVGTLFIARVVGLENRIRRKPRVEFFGIVSAAVVSAVSAPLSGFLGVYGVAWIYPLVMLATQRITLCFSR